MNIDQARPNVWPVLDLNRLDPDQARPNVWPVLDLNCLTLK